MDIRCSPGAIDTETGERIVRGALRPSYRSSCPRAKQALDGERMYLRKQAMVLDMLQQLANTDPFRTSLED